MQVFSFNPFFWNNSSKSVQSRVVDFHLKSSDLSPMTISNTTKLIDITLPLQSKSVQAERYNLNKSGEGYWAFHTIDIPENHNINIELQPLNKCLHLDVFLKYGGRPSLSDYQFSWKIPNASNCSNGTYLKDICTHFKAVTAHLNGSFSNCTETENMIYNYTKTDGSCNGQNNPYKLFLSNTDTKSGRYYLGELIRWFKPSSLTR